MSFSHPPTNRLNGHARSQTPSTKGKTMATTPSPLTSLLPPKWLGLYDDFITKNAGSVGNIESALRSLTYIIPGRFRDAEIASETVHSGVQLLSLYHDFLLRRVSDSTLSSPYSSSPLSPLSPTSTLSSRTTAPTSTAPMPTPHARYTKYWTAKSPFYRRVALLLQMIKYTELLCEMTAARRGGEKSRWRVVVLLEFIKATCRLLLLRVTRSRPLLSSALPDREHIAPPTATEDDGTEDQDHEATKALSDLLGEDVAAEWGSVTPSTPPPQPTYQKPWQMPRTGMSLPSLPNATDISSYLLDRVLTADDIKPAAKLMNPSSTPTAAAAEVLHIMAPLAYAILLSRAKDKKKAWHPWVVGIALEVAARGLRERGGFKTTGLEREEWAKRAWAMGWWGMRGAFYEHFVKGAVGGVKARVPRLVGGILEDYEYLWENYYFSTSRS